MTKTEFCRYYYANTRSFEQSLDVYKPVVDNDGNGEGSSANTSVPPPVVVVLVVGSAWLGHRSIIYTGTSWWNSSGPKAFAQQGYVTVCIRHRGSFPRIATGTSDNPCNTTTATTTLLLLLVPISILFAMCTAMYKYPEKWQDCRLVAALVIGTTIIVATWMLLAMGARGAANFETMLDDVANALCWVQRHKGSHLLQLGTSSVNVNVDSTSRQQDEEEKKDSSDQGGASSSSSKTPLVVFGGYSSGGHVAATLLQRPDVFESKGLPAPHEFCDAALFISGVLAVRPPITTTTTTATTVGQPPTTDDDNDERSDTDNTMSSSLLSSSSSSILNSSPSTWCTDLVTQVVFGISGAATLPSPLHGIHNHPNVPHVLIGCKDEVFGLSWMDVFFCSKAFCESLRQRNVPAKLVQVSSDHWNILGSKALRNTIREELEWIMKVVLE